MLLLKIEVLYHLVHALIPLHPLVVAICVLPVVLVVAFLVVSLTMMNYLLQ